MGTLILCPGCNGNGEEMVEEAGWSEFARQNNLNLAALSFASPETADAGYYEADSGSGQVLLNGLDCAFGSKRGSLLLYGFSRGAQFTYSLVRWKPDLVLSWCAYSATAWRSPAPNASKPAGIIACGDEDEPNYSASAFQFLLGRSVGSPWTWVSLAGVGHRRSEALEAFVRAYFAGVLRKSGNGGIWLDVETKMPLTVTDLRAHPELGSWLPDQTVAGLWKSLHQP